MSRNKQIVQDLTAVVKFEQWMRFYFIKKDGDTLIVAPDAAHMEKIQALYGNYYELAKNMCENKMTPEISQRLVIDFIRERFEGDKYRTTQIHNTLESKEFSMEIYLFNTWLELHEKQLIEMIIGYDEWVGLYETWKNSEQGQKVLISMGVSADSSSRENSSETIH